MRGVIYIGRWNFMAKEEGRIRFHYGFYAAMKVEYDLMHADVTYEQEIQLGEDPIRLDFLIIKKNSGVILTDPIGKFFEAVNLFEYKSPADSFSIDDFYKAVAYSFIYKGYNRKVDELPIDDITLTLVRHSYPRELMNALKERGYIIKEQYPGIYRIDGKIDLKVQIIVSSRLPADDYEGLKLLASGCKKDTFLNYAGKTVTSKDGNIKTNAGTVIRICLGINKKLDKQLEEDEAMKDVIARIFKDECTAQRQEGRNETYKSVAKDMLRKNLPLSLIGEISKLSDDSIRSLAKSLGLSVV